jgi:hypothetical protein
MPLDFHRSTHDLRHHLHSDMPARPSEVLTKARFATYCLLSLTSVAVFRSKPSEDTKVVVQLLWAAIPFLATVIFHGINDFVNGRHIECTEACIPHYYAAPISIVLVVLGQFATWTQSHLVAATTTMDRGIDAQACAIHFALSFFLLSECEFYRLYWSAYRQESPLNLSSLFDIIHEANNDRNFEESRDCINYQRPYAQIRGDCMSRETFKQYLEYSLHGAFSHLVAMACLNYPIKRLVNPDPKGDSFPLSAQFLEVFFTPKHQILLWLDIQLQRPIRLLNRMLLWSIVEMAEKAWRVWDNTDKQGDI